MEGGKGGGKEGGTRREGRREGGREEGREGGREEGRKGGRRKQEGAKHAVVVNVLSHSDTRREGERKEVEKSKLTYT